MVSPLASLAANIPTQRSSLTGIGEKVQGLQQSDASFQQGQQQISQEQGLQRAKFLNRLGKTLLSADESQWPGLLSPHTGVLQQMGYSLEQLQGLTREQIENVVAQTDAVMPDQSSLQTAGQRERQALLQDLKSNDPNIRKSAEIELRLKPGAGVTTGKERIATDRRLTEDVAESEAIIAQRKKFAELTGSSRAKKVDDGFEKIQGIDKNIRNLDAAVSALDEGAGTGRIESTFFPTIKAATVKLEQIQNELALDVIGATTFGALSKGELDLARETALPTNLPEAELRQYLLDKKSAQQKLRSYYEEQIDFLDQGGTVAGFLRKKKREAGEAPAQNAFTSSSGIQFTVD